MGPPHFTGHHDMALYEPQDYNGSGQGEKKDSRGANRRDPAAGPSKPENPESPGPRMKGGRVPGTGGDSVAPYRAW